jgi:hypothetical protein
MGVGNLARSVKPRHLSWVSSMTWITSDTTMQAAVSSLNIGVLRRADSFIEGDRTVQVGDGQVDENQLGHASFLSLLFAKPASR